LNGTEKFSETHRKHAITEVNQDKIAEAVLSYANTGKYEGDLNFLLNRSNVETALSIIGKEIDKLDNIIALANILNFFKNFENEYRPDGLLNKGPIFEEVRTKAINKLLAILKTTPETDLTELKPLANKILSQGNKTSDSDQLSEIVNKLEKENIS
jgi:hypothetical protein